MLILNKTMRASNGGGGGNIWDDLWGPAKAEAAEPMPVATVVSMAPVQKKVKTDIVPFYIYNAAVTLLDAPPEDVTLSNQTRTELTYIAAKDHDLCVVDPWITITDSIQVHDITVFLKESVPVSHLIVAKHYKLTYCLESVERSYATVPFKPFKGRTEGKYQSFNLAQKIDALLTPTQASRLKGHFEAIGPMTPDQVAVDYSFVEGQLELIGPILQK